MTNFLIRQHRSQCFGRIICHFDQELSLIVIVTLFLPSCCRMMSVTPWQSASNLLERLLRSRKMHICGWFKFKPLPVCKTLLCGNCISSTKCLSGKGLIRMEGNWSLMPCQPWWLYQGKGLISFIKERLSIFFLVLFWGVLVVWSIWVGVIS